MAFLKEKLYIEGHTKHKTKEKTIKRQTPSIRVTQKAKENPSLKAMVN